MTNTLTLRRDVWTIPIIAGAALTAISYGIAVAVGWTTFAAMSVLEVAAVFTSYICTIMCVYQTRWNYPVGVVTTFLYSWLFFQWEMYAVALFNLYLVFSLAYGWFRWGPDETTRPVGWIDGWWWFGYVAVGAVIYGLLIGVNHVFGVTITNVEIAITVLSGVAQFMLDNKKIENWLVWATVNVMSIWFYFHGELYLVALQYVFFLFNTAFGFARWRSSK
jgi:nicotinamide mononucleotide transporter